MLFIRVEGMMSYFHPRRDLKGIQIDDGDISAEMVGDDGQMLRFRKVDVGGSLFSVEYLLDCESLSVDDVDSAVEDRDDHFLSVGGDTEMMGRRLDGVDDVGTLGEDDAFSRLFQRFRERIESDFDDFGRTFGRHISFDR